MGLRVSRAAVDGPEPASFGARLRALRLERGWTLSELGIQAGISVPTLSKLENNRQAVGLDKLHRLSVALEVSTDTLVQAEVSGPSEVTLTRRSVDRGEADWNWRDNVIADRYLATDLLNKQMTPLVADTIARSVEEYGGWSRHPGEELTFVVSGKLDFRTELYTPVLLEPGDSIYFDAQVGHAYLTASKDPCRFLSVTSLAKLSKER